jgi:hypothetical protein
MPVNANIPNPTYMTELPTQQEKNALAVQHADNQTITLGFNDAASFSHLQRVAGAFAHSDMVPERFRNNLPNCIIGLELAHRLDASPLAVMQSLYIVGGEPGWRTTFVIANVNRSRRFTALQCPIDGEGPSRGCSAWATERETGERLDGPRVDMKMAAAEGWIERKGSKWKTMPDVMLGYRAATLWARLYCPEALLGMRTIDELEDIGHLRARRIRGRVIERPDFGTQSDEKEAPDEPMMPDVTSESEKKVNIVVEDGRARQEPPQEDLL